MSILGAYVLRSARIWLGLRGLAILVLAYANLPPLPRSFGAFVIFVAVTTTLCIADVWRRRERALLGNLGVSMPQLTGMSVAFPMGAELSLLVTSTLYP